MPELDIAISLEPTQCVTHYELETSAFQYWKEMKGLGWNTRLDNLHSLNHFIFEN